MSIKYTAVLTAGFCLAGVNPVAYAAEPAEATLNFDQLEVEYTAGPFVNANVMHQQNNGEEPTCMSPVLECDEFQLTLDFPEDLGELYPTALVRFVWTWDDPVGGVIDFDFFIADADGNIINNGGVSGANPESTAIVLPTGMTTYTLLGVPFLATGQSFTGKVTVDLGLPAEVDEGKETTESRALRSTMAGGGAAPFVVLLSLLGLGLLRSRARRSQH